MTEKITHDQLIAQKNKLRLKKLKKIGESCLKKYSEPIPTNCIEYIDKYMLTYVREDCFIKKQNTLSVSLLNGKQFDFPNHLFLTIKEIFGEVAMSTTRVFPNRGYTVIFIF